MRNKIYWQATKSEVMMSSENEILAQPPAHPSVLSESEKIKLANHVQTIPAFFRRLYERVLVGGASPRQVIKAKCQECVGYEYASTRIRECRCFKCPLWLMRPYQSKEQNPENDPTEPDEDESPAQ